MITGDDWNLKEIEIPSENVSYLVCVIPYVFTSDESYLL